MPEFRHIYPTYRLHVVSGRVVPADAGTIQDGCTFVQRITRSGPSLVLAPLGVGGHVDHVLTRSVAEHSGARVVYYSDFPYNQRHPADDSFVRRNGLVKMQWRPSTEAKAKLIRAYRTQAHALFLGDDIPLVPEVFFCPEDLGIPLKGGNN